MKLFKKKIVLFLIVAVVIAGGAYFAFGRKEKVEYVTAKVERGQILQTVSETGTVRAAKEIDLNFPAAGQIAKILVKEGDKVKKDAVLAELDYSAFAIKEREAQASLDKLLAGAGREEIAVAQANVNQAKTAYASALDELEKIRKTVEEDVAQAQKRLSDLTSETAADMTAEEQAVAVAETSLANAKSTYQKSIDNKREALLTAIESKLAVANTALDNINTILNDEDAKNTLSVEDTSYLTYAKDTYNDAVSLLAAANGSLTVAKTDSSDAKTEKAENDAAAALNKTLTSLNYCYGALEKSVASSSFTQSELDTYKTNVNTQITNVTSGISSVETAKQNFDDAGLAYETNVASAEKSLSTAQTNLDAAALTAKNNLATATVSGDQKVASAEAKADAAFESWQVAKAQFDKTKAPARSEDLAAAQAAVDSVKKQIENSLLKAPLDGTITKVNYEVGESPSAAKPVVSMLGENNFEIEVLISEADIAKVAKEEPVEITLDAFGSGVKFSGKVSFIEPASTVVQDVVYYKVDIIFANESESSANLANIKPGMTANVVVTTASKDNVLIMPARAVVEKNGSGKIVRVLINNEVMEMPVEIGLRGDGGMVEVLSGVKEGDEAVVSIKNQK